MVAFNFDESNKLCVFKPTIKQEYDIWESGGDEDDDN